jgi:hypothetical protein
MEALALEYAIRTTAETSPRRRPRRRWFRRSV